MKRRTFSLVLLKVVLFSIPMLAQNSAYHKQYPSFYKNENERILPTVDGGLILSSLPTPRGRPYPPPVIYSKSQSLRTNLHSSTPAIGKPTAVRKNSTGIIWGPIIKLSPDVALPNGNYGPKIAVQGNTLHCTWFGGQFRLPYIRSTNSGLTWESPRELLLDSSVSSCITDWQQIVVDSKTLYIFFVFGYCQPGPESRPVYFVRSTDLGTNWSSPIQASNDSTGPIFSANARNDTMCVVYTPRINGQGQYPRVTRTTDAGVIWTRSLQEMPSSSSDQLQVAITPGMLDFFHPGDRWPGPAPEIVLHRSTDLGDSWKDSTILSTLDGDGSDVPRVFTWDNANGNRTLALLWRDTKYGGCGLITASVLARLSFDNGSTWGSEVNFTDEPCGFRGGIAVRNNFVAATWMQEGSPIQEHRIQARVSYDSGKTLGSVCEVTPPPFSNYALHPSIALSDSAVHVVWEEKKDSRWNIFYRRGELQEAGYAVSATSFDFDTIAISCSRSESLLITNTQSVPLILTAVVSDSLDFSVSPYTVVIQPQETEALTIRFYPLSTGKKVDQIILTNNQNSIVQGIPIGGTAVGTGNEVVIADSIGTDWQLVSVPVVSSCPYILNDSYFFSGSYSSTDSLFPGKGYWNKLEIPKISFIGMHVSKETIAVSIGWNLIGSISTPVSVDNITSEPAGIVTSQFFGYGENYFTSDSIYPGRACWVKVNSDGTLVLDATTTASLWNKIQIVPTDDEPPPPPNTSGSNQKLVIPSRFSLEQNYPNPFNSATRIEYALSEDTFVRLKIINVLGQEVATLANNYEKAGWNRIDFEAGNLPSGIYFYRLETNKYSFVRKMLLLK